MQRASTTSGTLKYLYKGFKTACQDAKVRHMEPFNHLLDVVKQLMVTLKSFAESPKMLVFTDKVIRLGQAIIIIHQTTNELSQYLKGTKDISLKQRVAPDITKLKQKQTEIKRYIKYFSIEILQELGQLKNPFKVEEYRESPHKFKQFVHHYNDYILNISNEIGEYKIILTSLKTKIKETSNEDEMRLMAICAGAGTLASVLVVAMMSNPVTAIIGGIGLAGMSLAGGIWAGLRSTTSESQPDTFETSDMVNNRTEYRTRKRDKTE